jgi:colicin import membrane protein
MHNCRVVEAREEEVKEKAKGAKTAWLAVLASGFLDPVTFSSAMQVRKLKAKTKLAHVVRSLQKIKYAALKKATPAAADKKAAADKAADKKAAAAKPAAAKPAAPDKPAKTTADKTGKSSLVEWCMTVG